MDRETLDGLAAAEIRLTLAGLPTDVRKATESCVIEAVYISDCLACGERLEDGLLGLFQGCSLQDGMASVPSDLPRIRLFLDNLWDYCNRNTTDFREEVRVTLLHELGHYLGFNEEEIEDRGLA